MKLSTACDTTLKDAEKKVNKLMQEEAEEQENEEANNE